MTDSKRHDIAIIGGGIVGMATAMTLANDAPGGTSILVVEAENRLAAHQTGNNSGVAHAGLYYKPGSLKARYCASGREALYRFCAEQGVACENCGKLIVATSQEELPRLDDLEKRGRENNLAGIRRLGPEEARQFEPHVAALAALHVPQTGIVDYIGMTQAFGRILESKGGEIRKEAKVRGVRRLSDELVLETTHGEFHARHLINCGGLHSDRIARMCGVDPKVQIVPFRGEYYELIESRRFLVKNLIYPVPDPRFPFLGVHFTRMAKGGIEAGPNAVWALKREGYSWRQFSFKDTWEAISYSGFRRMALKYWRTGMMEMYRSLSKRAFVKALQRLVPELQMEDVIPAGAGVRAMALGPDGALVDDFRIESVDRMIHVLNAPSPAATACLAIGKHISDLARDDFRFKLEKDLTAEYVEEKREEFLTADSADVHRWG